MPKVFISYAEEMAEKASLLCNRLKEQKKIQADIQTKEQRKTKPRLISSTISTADHFLPFLSRNGVNDPVLKEDISIALRIYKEHSKEKNFIVPLVGEECDPGAYGLGDFPHIPLYRNSPEDEKELISKIVKTDFLSLVLNSSLTKNIMMKLFSKLLLGGGITALALRLASMGDEESIPEYNLKAFAADIRPGEAFAFLDPDSDDEEEAWIKTRADKKGWYFRPFFMDAQGNLILRGQAQKTDGGGMDETEAVPEHTALILVALGDEKILNSPDLKPETGHFPDSDKTVIWLMYA